MKTFISIATGTFVLPEGGGSTNWWSPSYSLRTGLFYVVVDESSKIFFQEPAMYNPTSKTSDE